MSNNTTELWYFYHKLEKAKFGPLTLVSLCTFLISHNIGLDEVFLCQKDWKKWKKGLETEDFVAEYKFQLEKDNDFLPIIDDIEEDSLINPPPTPIDSTKDWVSVRKHPRLELELKVIFVADKKTFRTKSKDLSLGGIQITDPLPESFYNKNIQVFISSPDLKISIKFEAILLPNKTSTTQIKFVSQNEGSLQFLEKWLSSVQNIKKSA